MGASCYFCKRLGERKTGMLGSVAAFDGCFHAFDGTGRWLLELLLLRTILVCRTVGGIRPTSFFFL